MASTAHSAAAKPGPVAIQVPSDTASSKRDLATWWKHFKKSGPFPKSPIDAESQPPLGIFGVALHESIRYANVPISLLNDKGESYIYGYVPIIVAKCGIFLKDKATEVEGIFRLAGSEKRIKELKVAFDSPDRYGKSVDWTGYTVHDAANILRRYFNQLPEPIIPLDFYERFRNPMKSNPQLQAAISNDDGTGLSTVDIAIKEEAIRTYQTLITQLSPLNRQLLLYILDLLAVFAAKAEYNKMTNPNLAAIFQPGILSHPQHDLAPAEYLLSQNVLVFLIENQDSFLIGMHGTAADAKTVRDVQNAGIKQASPIVSSSNSSSNNSLLRRSSSNASGGDSTRRWGGLRRNVSVASRESPVASGSIISPTLSTRTSGSGVNRSNTVPSGRPARPIAGTAGRFNRDRTAESPSASSRGASSLVTPIESGAVPHDNRLTGASGPSLAAPVGRPVAKSASSSETVTPYAMRSPTDTVALRPAEVSEQHFQPVEARLHTAARAAIPAPVSVKEAPTEHSSSAMSTPSPRQFLDKLKKQPEVEKKSKKLQKKRREAGSLSSAQSSQLDLTSGDDTAETERREDVGRDDSNYALEHDDKPSMLPPSIPVAAQRTATDATLRARSSSALSSQSRTTTTDSDGEGDEAHVDKKSKRRWRFRRGSRAAEQHTTASKATSPAMEMGSSLSNDLSRTGETRESLGTASSLGSGDKSGKASDAAISPAAEVFVVSDSDEKKKGPMTWIKTKLIDRKDRDLKSPTKTTAIGEFEKISGSHVSSPSEHTPTNTTSQGGS